MGYKNPRNYFIQDPTAGARAFEKSFKETFTQIDDYYTGLKQTAQKKNIELATESQKLQDEINKMEKLGSNAKEGIRQMVTAKMNELKSSVKTEEGGIFTKAFTAKVSGPTPQEMNEAINGIKDFSSDLNKTLDMAYKFDETKVDNGGKNFKYVKAMINHLKENPDAIEYNYKNGKFDFELKFNHPIYGDQVLNRSVVTSMINEVDGSSVNRSSLDEMYKGRISALEGQIKSHVSEREKELKANNQTGLASGIDYATQRVSNEVENMEDDRIESFYFNNSKVNKPEQQWEAFKNLDNEIAQDINNQIESKPNYLKPKINAALMNLLNNPNSDEATFEREFDRLGLVGISKEDFSEAILDYRMDVVKESMIQDVISKGVISGVNVRKDTKFKYRQNSETKLSSLPPEDEEILTSMWNYKGENMQFIPGDKELETGGTVTSLDEGGSFTRGKVRASGRQQDVQFVEQEQGSEKLKIFYGQQGRSKEVDKKDPDAMFFAFKDLAIGKVKQKDFNNIMLKEFSTDDGLARLDNNGMSKWVKWLSRRGQKDRLINYLAEKESRGIPLMSSTINTWEDFYKENKKAIDLKMINAARANK